MRHSAVVIIWRLSAVTEKGRKDIKNAEKTITATKSRRDENVKGKEKESGREREREIESEKGTKREMGWSSMANVEPAAS